MPDLVEVARLALAALVALTALGALNKMHRGTTRPCVAGAMVLVFAGAAGQLAAGLRSEYDEILDLLLLGGICAFLLASQRVPTWWLERVRNPGASVVLILVAGIFAAWAVSARADEGPVAVKCANLAQVIERAATYRDVDANRDKFVAYVERLMAAASEEQRAVVRRELRRLWAERRPGAEAAFAVYRRCVAQLGDMGKES